MRLPKKAGEEAQVDYAGHTAQVIDPKTRELHQSADLRWSSGSQRPDLRRSALEPEPAQLDPGARAHVQLLRRCSPDRVARQPQGWRDQAVLLRTGPQPDLPRNGGALWCGGDSDAGAQAQGQGPGRERRPASRALGLGRPAGPKVFQLARTQPGHPGAAQLAERPQALRQRPFAARNV